MKRVYNLENIITKIFENILFLFFSIIIVMTILLVILRYIFNTGIFGGNELVSYLFIYTTALGASISIVKRDHIKITYFIDKLPAIPRIIIDIIGYLLVIFINGVMIFYSYNWIKKSGMSETPTLRIPNWIIQISVPVGCSLVIIYCIYLIIIDIYEKNNKLNGEIK